MNSSSMSNNNQIANPNQFFVFGFTDADLGGSKLVLQPLRLVTMPAAAIFLHARSRCLTP
ncbi:MAG TPA: hypothetical protein VHX37_18150 [Acidobacteriaceae bacterium]|jgi:hypothetical protein|nr:hypothetical protein [Acidobacteriaceae bacterium]